MSAAANVVELCVEDVAVLLGASRYTARRLMVRLEAEYGEDVVYRRAFGKSKRRLLTTSAAIAPFIPKCVPVKSKAEVDVEKLRVSHIDIIARFDRLQEEFRKFRQISHSWFTRKT